MKRYLDQFVIPFKGLKEGPHTFNFEIGKRFFEEFEHAVPRGGKVIVDLKLERQKTMLVFNFHLHGHVRLACDRCLDHYDQKIEGKYTFIAKLSDFQEPFDQEEEITVLADDVHEYDISQQIYEYISLLLPIKHVHDNRSDCDPEMLKRINEEQTSATDGAFDKHRDVLEALKKNIDNN